MKQHIKGRGNFEFIYELEEEPEKPEPPPQEGGIGGMVLSPNKVFELPDGNLGSVQAAVGEAAQRGDTILIPDGDWAWEQRLNIEGKSVNLIGASKEGVTIRFNVQSPPDGTFHNFELIRYNYQSATDCEIAFLSFAPGPRLSGLFQNAGRRYMDIWPPIGQDGRRLNRGIPLIHHCHFDSPTSIGQGLRMPISCGVVWNCHFHARTFPSYTNGILCAFFNIDRWRLPTTQGTLDSDGRENLYIEDCVFDNHIYLVDASDNCRMVFRHNVCNDATVGSHGPDSAPAGLRHLEVYNNEFRRIERDYNASFVVYRGGSGVIFGNKFAEQRSFPIQLLVRNAYMRSTSPAQCPRQYPSPRQVGQGWQGGLGTHGYPEFPQGIPGVPGTWGDGYILDPLHIWDNDRQEVHLVDMRNDPFNDCRSDLPISHFLQRDRDFVVGRPRPNYTPYAYPHPARQGK